VGLAAFGGARLLAKAPALAESTVGRATPEIARMLSLMTGEAPISLAELVVALYAIARISGLVSGVVALVRRPRRWREVLGAGLRTAARDAGVIVLLFYALWGWNYSRPPIETRLGLPELGRAAASARSAPADSALIARLSHDLVMAGNDAYRAIHRSDDAGRPTRFRGSLDALDNAVERGWRRAAANLALKSGEEKRRGRFKPLTTGTLTARLGLSGFYFPFTGEANVIREVPAVMLPHVIAHEKAHQRGIGPEDEANFLGCLAALSSPDPVVRYAGLIFAQRQLLRVHFSLDTPAARELVTIRVPGVQRDIDDLAAFWQRYEGPVSEVSNKLNDAYLKSNRVEGGMESYGKSVELLIRYAATRGGRLTGPTP
jgi:hypothetical protein